MRNKRELEKNSIEQIIIDPLIKEFEISMVLKQRVIPLYDEVTRESMFKVLYWIDKLVSLDEKEGVKRPIELAISSYGGYCSHGLSVCSKIIELREKGWEIITTVRDVAYSMGAMLLLCGSKRRAYRYSDILIHQVSAGTVGEIQTMREGLEDSERTWKLMQQIIKENTNISQEQLDDITLRKFDWVLTPKQALELNVIDEIL